MTHHNQHFPLHEKIQDILFRISFLLEFLIAGLVIILIICQIIGLSVTMFGHLSGIFETENFNHYLELCLNIVIGIEFLKMLCRHNMDAVVEVLLFTLSRHLILSHATMLEGLLCIIAIAILFVVRKFLFVAQVDRTAEEKAEHEALKHNEDSVPDVNEDDTRTNDMR